jgi:tRNA threonylcarbamoyl adenosine modification protein (Sua5/YciO/YrdC/YwlC family)
VVPPRQNVLLLWNYSSFEAIMLLEIDPYNPDHKLIRKVVHSLKEGEVIAYPTDTVYGLGCDMLNKDAIEKIYRLKKIPRYKPLSIISADLKEISVFAHVSNLAYKLMKRVIPGPYTFILPATKNVPRIMLTNQRTVGIRVPDNEICLTLVRELGNPLISSSASVASEEILSDPVEIEHKFGKDINLIIDGGSLISELSSVIDLTGLTPKIVREGKGDLSLFY